jgi:hypothetical protein
MPAVLPSHPEAEISHRNLWFGATAAAIAWALQGVTCEVIASEACRTSSPPGGTKVVLGVVTLIALAVAAAATLVSFRNWRKLSDGFDLIQAEAVRRGQFMGLIGVFAGIVLAGGILWSGLPLLFLDVCVKSR